MRQPDPTVTWASPLDQAQMVYNHLREEAYVALSRREARYEELKTVEDVTAYQERLRAFFISELGGFPQERTPLNARIVGTIPRDGYRIEKVILESEPNHHITGSAYVPDGPGPFPAVLVLVGHADVGKVHEGYQRACPLLARNGLLALCCDPIGQGERSQALEANGKPKYGCTSEHSIIDIGSIFLGTNTARYRIYDGMRAVDYLTSRSDVIPTRIGCVGESGGGTLTSYLMALEPRIACAAPGCFLTSMRRLLVTRGPQDGEQNIHNDIGFGMDHADFIIMRAPKPTLMLTATQDYFDIVGAWDTFRQAKRIYTRLGFPERMSLTETDFEHGFSLQLREAAVRWMRRWLLGIDDAVTEKDVPILSEEELQITPEGQVMRLPGERSVYQMNAELGRQAAASRAATWKKAGTAEALRLVREKVGIRPASELGEMESVCVGWAQQEGYGLRRWQFTPEEGITISALAFEPAKPDADAYLYVHSKGKEADAGIGGPLAKLAKAGHLVLALDVRGVGGEAGGRLWKDSFLAYRLGRTYLGLRAEDILMAAKFLSHYEEQTHHVNLIGVEDCGPVALHAAALEPELFASVTLRRSLVSWGNLVEIGDVPLEHFGNIVHGALEVYDLPDLVASLRSKVIIEEPVDALGRPAGKSG